MLQLRAMYPKSPPLLQGRIQDVAREGAKLTVVYSICRDLSANILPDTPIKSYFFYFLVTRLPFFVCGGGKEKGLVNLVYHRRWPIPRFWGLNCTASGMM